MLSNEQILELKKLILKKTPITKIAKQFGTSRQNIYNLCAANDIPYGKNNFYLTVNETYKGIPYKVYCKQFHIAPVKVRDLMKMEGLSLVEAIDKLRSEKSKYSIDGIPAWKIAQKNGISYRLFWNRISAGKTVEEAIQPRKIKDGGYRKSVDKLIKGINEKNLDCINLLPFIFNDMSKNLKVEYKTIKDAEDFLTGINVKYDERRLNDFWNYYKKAKTFNFSEVWYEYITDSHKRKLWGMGDF